MPKLGGSLIQIAFVERGAALGNVQVDILVAVVSEGKFTALLEFSRRLILASRPRQRQPQLIVGLATLRVEARRLLELGDRFRHFSIL